MTSVVLNSSKKKKNRERIESYWLVNRLFEAEDNYIGPERVTNV